MPETGLEMRMNCLPKSDKSKKNRYCIILHGIAQLTQDEDFRDLMQDNST